MNNKILLGIILSMAPSCSFALSWPTIGSGSGGSSSASESNTFTSSKTFTQPVLFKSSTIFAGYIQFSSAIWAGYDAHLSSVTGTVFIAGVSSTPAAGAKFVVIGNTRLEGNILFSSSTAGRTISVSSSSNQGSLTISAGDGAESNGGPLILNGGAGQVGNPGVSGGIGGGVFINGGLAPSFAGGSVVVAGGLTGDLDGSGSFGGSVTVRGGNNSPQTGPGGDVNAYGGIGLSSGNVILLSTGPTAPSFGRLGIGTTKPGTLVHISSGVLTIDGSGGANFGGGVPVRMSSAVFVGLMVSTNNIGGAGAATTALCPVGNFATGGGCDCGGGVALTGMVARPNCVTTGCVPNGYTCQEPGGTGGACSAYVICSRLQ